MPIAVPPAAGLVLAVAGVAGPTPATWAGTWQVDPGVAVGLVGLTVLYAQVVRRWWSSGRRVGIPPARVGAFAAGVVVVALAVLSPLDALGSALLSAHMAQHLLLAVVAAPLLVAGRAHRAALAVVPVGWRRRFAAPVARTLRRRWPLGSVVAVLLHVAVLLAWHVPVLYGAALQHDWVHAVEHATMVGAAIPFWIAVGADRPTPAATAFLAAFAASLAAIFLAAAMTVSAAPWYADHLATTGPWGLSALQDQQLAAAILWVPGGVVYLGTGVVAVVRWLRADERANTRRADRRAAPPRSDPTT